MRNALQRGVICIKHGKSSVDGVVRTCWYAFAKVVVCVGEGLDGTFQQALQTVGVSVVGRRTTEQTLPVDAIGISVVRTAEHTFLGGIVCV